MKSYLWDMTDEEIEEEYWQNEIAGAVDEAIEETTTKVTDSVTKKVSEESYLNMARRLIEGGQLSIADIARYTGFSIERIETMSKETNVV